MDTKRMWEESKKSERCTCTVCKRGRKFRSIINKLKDEEDREWMEEFMNFHCCISEDHEVTKVYLEGLQIKTGQRVGLGEAIDLINGKLNPSDEEDKKRENDDK